MRKTISELWNNIFEDYDILNQIKKQGYYNITADQIRDYKEPRLMAKFDFYKQLPKIFKDNDLGILPIKNGEYIIGKFNLFENISNKSYDEIDINTVHLPDFIETIDPDNIYSESNALNVALISGMLKDAFGEDLFETIQGKMRTNNFKFNISSKESSSEIEVNKAAIEIDGGYETKTKVILIEAKNSMPEDFIIRQLYYPYRHWKSKTTKEIIPVFFAYENGIYNLFIYSFTDLYNYNSLKLKDIKRYMITSSSSEDIKKKIYNDTKTVDEKAQFIVPFPQADSFTKVLGTLELINTDINTAISVSEELYFDKRQGKYYIDALRYLGLVEKSKERGKYNLSQFGLDIIDIDIKSKNVKIIKEILKHKPFYEIYKYYLENDNMPSKKYIKDILRKYVPEISEKTVNRRASTIKSWVLWIIGSQI